MKMIPKPQFLRCCNWAIIENLISINLNIIILFIRIMWKRDTKPFCTAQIHFVKIVSRISFPCVCGIASKLVLLNLLNNGGLQHGK